MASDSTSGRSVLDDALRLYLSLTKRAVLGIAVAVLVLMVAINGLEIVGRGLFQRSFTWVQEVSIIAAMWVYFAAYAVIAKDDEYIRVDILAGVLSESARRAMTVFAHLATIVFHATVLWFAFETWKFLDLFRTSVLDWPESLFVVPIVICAADILITELIHLRWVLVGREHLRLRNEPPEIA